MGKKLLVANSGAPMGHVSTILNRVDERNPEHRGYVRLIEGEVVRRLREGVTAYTTTPAVYYVLTLSSFSAPDGKRHDALVLTVNGEARVLPWDTSTPLKERLAFEGLPEVLREAVSRHVEPLHFSDFVRLGVEASELVYWTSEGNAVVSDRGFEQFARMASALGIQEPEIVPYPARHGKKPPLLAAYDLAEGHILDEHEAALSGERFPAGEIRAWHKSAFADLLSEIERKASASLTGAEAAYSYLALPERTLNHVASRISGSSSKQVVSEVQHDRAVVIAPVPLRNGRVMDEPISLDEACSMVTAWSDACSRRMRGRATFGDVTFDRWHYQDAAERTVRAISEASGQELGLIAGQLGSLHIVNRQGEVLAELPCTGPADEAVAKVRENPRLPEGAWRLYANHLGRVSPQVLKEIATSIVGSATLTHYPKGADFGSTSATRGHYDRLLVHPRMLGFISQIAGRLHQAGLAFAVDAYRPQGMRLPDALRHLVVETGMASPTELRLAVQHARVRVATMAREKQRTSGRRVYPLAADRTPARRTAQPELSGFGL